MAIVTLIPKCVLESETIDTMKRLGMHVEEGSCTIGTCKVNCVKVLNLTETQIFDKLDSMSLLESVESEKISFAARVATVLFMQIRKVSQIKDKDLKALGAASLLASVTSLASLDTRTANRFLQLVRALSS